MSEFKKIIAALLLAFVTIVIGCIIVDCSMAEMTNEKPYTFVILDKFNFLKTINTNPLFQSVKDL